METLVANDEDINNHLQLIQQLRANSASVSKRALFLEQISSTCLTLLPYALKWSD